MGFIYMLTSPSGKSYIGQTIRTIEDRFKAHQQPSSGCVAIYGAIQYHGWENFEKHWYEVPDEELNDHEELMVEVLGTLAPNGYNLKEGGGSKGKASEESRKKMSEAQSGKTHTKETRMKMSISRTGENHPMYGKTHTDETKIKLRAAFSGEKHPMYGKARSDETKKRISAAKKGEKTHTKTIFQYDMGNSFIQSFDSSKEAAAHLNKRYETSIRRCARGERESAHGYRWSYTKLTHINTPSINIP
ncbi:GIY-YIG catalytic domain-containing endonuclease [Acanthocystis turfacea Chlorella virus TN603.4.2]|nr:GIY-YIG catalytic domain-containing endonuclease [Acanthocystis turfacea Chlorella virus TN603.4.2]